MNFEIGPGITCDLSRLIDTRLLVQANSGGGKSFLLRRLLEQTHGHVQHLVLDPEGEFSTLRERFDYVLAAKGGDTVAHPRSAALLAEKLLELGASAVIDLYELQHHDRVRFVRLFLEAMVDAPKRLWHPALVVVDEAHVFCPEKGSAESAGAVIDLATRGRKRGYCAVLATQRLAKLNKDAAAESNNKLIGRTALDVDMARAGDELGFTKAVQHELRRLKAGEFFAFGPAFYAPEHGDPRTTGVTKVTVGRVTTTHPKAGARLAFTAPPPTARIKALLPQLADLPAEAEQRATTVEELRREVAGLKRALKQAQEEAPKPIVEREEVLVLTEAARGSIDGLRETMRLANETLDKVMAEVMLRVAHPAVTFPPATATWPVRKPIRPGPVQTVTTQADTPRLDRCARAILTVLVQHPDGCAFGKLTLLTGYRNSGGFRNALGMLRTYGLIDGQNNGVMRATEAGVAALGECEPLPTGQQLVHYWLTHPSLDRAARAILSNLVAVPDGITLNELLAHTGYSNSGGFRNALGALRTAGLLVGRNGERMRACVELLEAAS